MASLFFQLLINGPINLKFNITPLGNGRSCPGLGNVSLAWLGWEFEPEVSNTSVLTCNVEVF